MTDIQKEENMTTNQRFVLDENRAVIDTLNPSSRKSYCHEGAPQDQAYLRERVLLVRLADLVNDLINLQPEETDWRGKKYKPYNNEGHSIWLAIYEAIWASQLNTLDPAMSVQNRFDGKLKRQKIGLQEFTSISLFRDDVECLLHDLYGGIDSKALERTLRSVLIIVEEFTQFVRKDLWQEHQDAMAWDYIWGIGLPDGYGISGSEHRRGMKGVSNLGARVREVRKNPSAFSKYTVEFARACNERIVVADCETELEVPF
jgi:hypothetical protein